MSSLSVIFINAHVQLMVICYSLTRPLSLFFLLRSLILFVYLVIPLFRSAPVAILYSFNNLPSSTAIISLSLALRLAPSFLDKAIKMEGNR